MESSTRSSLNFDFSAVFSQLLFRTLCPQVLSTLLYLFFVLFGSSNITEFAFLITMKGLHS